MTGQGVQGDGIEGTGIGAVALSVYRYLLEHPGARLAEIAEDLDLSIGVVRSVACDLASRQMVRPSQTDPGEWRPISPEVALRRLVAQSEAELAQRQEALARLRTGVRSFVDEYREAREARLTRLVEHLPTGDAVVGMLEELNENVRSEILAFVTNKPTAQAVEQSRANDEATLARGVAVRTIHLEGAMDKVFLDHASWLSDRGAQVRLAPTLPVRLLVFDRQVAVIAVDPADPSVGAVVVRGKGVLAALVGLFELQWDAARSPFGAGSATPAADGAGLSRMDAEVLRLLARGLKDDSVARHLGVSVRTARRFIADLAERAGAASRFELGVRAKELGWL